MVELEDIRYFIIPELYEYLSGLEAKVNGDDDTEPDANNEPAGDDDTEPEDNTEG